MALVTISGTIPETPGDSDLWAWRIVDANGAIRDVTPNAGTLSFTAESGTSISIRNPINAVKYQVTVPGSNTDLWAFLALGVLEAANPAGGLNPNARLSSASLGNSLWAAGHAEVCDRNDLGTVPPASGVLWLSYFTAPLANPITKLWVGSGGTAAAGTTVARLGLFTVAADGALTLVARTANTTTIASVTYTDYPVALDKAGGYPDTYAFVPGRRYAFGWLNVATTPAVIRGRNVINGGTPPILSRLITGQTDILASYSGGGTGHYQQAYLAGLAA